MANSSAKSSRAPFIAMSILIVLLAGLVVDATKSENDNFYQDIMRLDDVAQEIYRSYVEEVPSKDLVDNAVKGMLDILDPHTTYFEKKQYEELRIHTKGKFGGLGIVISIRDKVLTVMTPIAGTPASRAGIQSGDQIIKIDGSSTKGITIDKAVGKLRGEPDTDVTITIRRKGEAKPIDYVITRKIVHIKSVPFYGVMDKNIGYIRLTQFSEEASKEIEIAIDSLMKLDISGLVLDLRHNPGGLLPQAIEVSEKFLPEKSLVVSTRGRLRGQNNEFYSNSKPVLPKDVPLAILVNYASASASEIVAGAVQDYDRGIILGDTTFGKGSVQSILPLADKSHHLKLTTAFYYTPSGRCINKPENDIRGSEQVEEDPFDDQAESEIEAEEIADSADVDTTKEIYFTQNGRMVYGGGGIIPDTVVEAEKLEPVVRALFAKDVFFRFANIEYPKVKDMMQGHEEDFDITSELYQDFLHFLDSIDFSYTSSAEVRFEEFQHRAGLIDSTRDSLEHIADFPLLTPTMKTTMDSAVSVINSLLKSASKNEFQVHRSDIQRHLKEALLLRALGQDSPVVNRKKLSVDPQLQTAIDLLTKQNLYPALLSGDKKAVATGE